MNLLKLAAKSAWSRKVSLLLSIFSIALSIFLLLSVDTVRKQAKATFLNTISQTDLIVGARGGQESLLLYSVFHIGDATKNVSYDSYEYWARHPQVAWSVPISLGDSHKGFRVMGTDATYFEYYKYKDKQSLQFGSGKVFGDVYDAVIGYDVAQELGYDLGQSIVLTHGTSLNDMAQHDDKPFVVTGILKKTGTPVDKTVLVSLQAIEAIHVDWQGGMRSPLHIPAEMAKRMDLRPKTITAFMLGLKKKVYTFKLQRGINSYQPEPLQAILPGVTLASLWRTLGQFEKVMLAISALVLLTGLIGLLTTLLSTLNERRREVAVLRAIGMRPYQVFGLFALESVLVITSGCVLGVILLYALMSVFGPVLEQHYGIFVTRQWLDAEQIGVLLAAIALGTLMSVLPGWLAYRRSLQDGLTVKL